MQPSVDFDVEYVGSIKSALFGGQGIFFATLRGPGRIWLQSLTLDKLIARVASQLSARTSPSGSSLSTGGVGTTGSVGGAVLGALFGGGTAAAGESSETSAGGESDSGASAVGSDSDSSGSSGSS